MFSWLAYSAGRLVTGVPVKHRTIPSFGAERAIFTALFVRCAVGVLQ